MAWTLRTGQLLDIDAVLRLWVVAEAEPTSTDDAASLATLMTHDPRALMVAEVDGSVVGSVVAAWDGWRGSVYRLVVAPTHRRQGLGSELLRAAQAHLRERGAVRMQAIVVESDAKAMGFWRESGWQQQVSRVRFVAG